MNYLNFLNLSIKTFRKTFLLALWSVLVSYGSTVWAAAFTPDKEHKLATAVADVYLRSFVSQAEEQKNHRS